MSFKQFAEAVNAKYNLMAKGQLFVVDANKNDLWETYLDSFPEEENQIYKERRFYDCQCCKNFIRNIAGVVSLNGNTMDTIWNVDVPYPFNIVTEAMHNEVVSRQIKSSYFSVENTAGQEQSLQVSEGDMKFWDHFWASIPSKFVKDNKEELVGKQTSYLGVFKRGLEEISLETMDQIIDLIDSDSIYRGEEHIKAVKKFRQYLVEYEDSGKSQTFIWNNVSAPSIGFRNTVIGSLAVDIEKGVELIKAVKSFEAKVAPANYKRTKSLITPMMIKKAMEKIEELGISDSLQRRHAKTEDVTMNNVIFADRTTQTLMKGSDNLTSLLMEETTTAKVDKKNVKDIDIEDFIKNIVPKATLIEAMVENNKINNLMSVVAPQFEDAPNILKWDNNFSWSYNNNMTDSEMTQAVVSAGGRVDGVLRFTHSWNHKERNASLMDLHVFMPGNSKKSFGTKNQTYGTGRRVGWNRRDDKASGGKQDVDYTSVAPIGKIPVENITFPSISKLKDGVYTCAIHNWRFRSPTNGGFKAEIAFGTEVFQYEYKKPLANHEWVVVAEITLKNGVFTIDHKLNPEEAGKREWGINTNQFTKVDMIMNSPNHWDDNKDGNKHYFFILNGCLNPDGTRGIYNEFLKGELHEHRKVFEIIGEKTKCPMSAGQLSGIGFSSTKRADMLVKVDGKPFNIKF